MYQSKYTIIAIIVGLIYFNSGFSQCHIDDWTALKALYESTNGDNWEDKDGWEQMEGVAPPPDCNLINIEGVNVGLDPNTRVIELYLINNGLQGNLPSEISLLTELEELSLVNNELTGSLPASIGDLINLDRLNLDFNELSGALPPELGKLKNLEWLSLLSNNISGSIPPELCNLESIRHLYLGNNQLTGEIPAEFGKFREAFLLDLAYNQLTGSLPPEFGDIPFYIGFQLVLSGNQLSGCYDGNLLKLCDRLRSPLYDPHIPISIENNFDASWEDFCETGAGQCETVNTCYARDWRALKNLYEKTDGDNWSNRSGWDTLIANRETPPESCNLSDLYGVGINKIGRVDSISLPANQLIGDFPIDLSYLNDLRYLFLNGNQLSGKIHTETGFYLDSLEVFSAACNQLSGELPIELSYMPNLKVLCLPSNYLEGNIPAELGNLKHMEYLYLSNNDLSGSIPGALGGSTSLQFLDLSFNRLSDSIPSSFENLNRLNLLYLNDNDLTGTIPKSIGALSQLQNLKVQNNKLSGCYATELLALCDQLSTGFKGNASISAGNNFNIEWEAFCNDRICE